MNNPWLACLLVVVYFRSSIGYVGYQCYPDGSVGVRDLHPEVDAVYAFNAVGTKCQTSSIVNSSLIITGCPKDIFILFAYGTYDSMSTQQIHGGRNITVDNITCYEIAEAHHTVSQGFSANVSFASVQDLQVLYNVTSVLNASSVSVGDDVSMTIIYPANYYLEVSACTANPGSSYNVSTEIALVSNYCTQQVELITDFSGANGSVTAVIHAFKFYNVDDVFIRCQVKVCPQDNGNCITSCASGVGKRSAGSGVAYKTNVETVLHVSGMFSGAGQMGLSFTAAILFAVVTIL